MGWTDEIASFLCAEGFSFAMNDVSGIMDFRIGVPERNAVLNLDAVPVCSETLTSAEKILESASALRQEPGRRVFLAQDLWMGRREVAEKRILAQLGRFRSVFARNTEVRRITGPESGTFLSRWHTYGDASARYRYGLFSRDSGMVAVASFSSPRKWVKDNVVIKSYEWVRYASLPDVRVVGGMGKVLAAFMDEVGPDDIMSYADLEWTDGKTYETLGFVKESFRAPLLFTVDPVTWKRSRAVAEAECGKWMHYNMGSVKYRLRI